MAAPSKRVKVVRHAPDDHVGGRASLAVEEPLEIRVDGRVVATTMRTPGDDFDLALGFAITDGGVDPDRVGGMRYCGPDAGEVAPSAAAADLSGPYAGGFNTINLDTRDGSGPPVVRHRATQIWSACGICGADAVADLRDRAGSVANDETRLTPEVIAAVPPAVRTAQAAFDRTGGTHAAALSDADGRVLVVREDVGRHNAVDKVIGWAATNGHLPAGGLAVFTSGRIAFEIVAKAAIARAPAIIAVGAPTTLAVELAEAVGMTLVGFARQGEFTVYSGAHRVRSD